MICLSDRGKFRDLSRGLNRDRGIRVHSREIDHGGGGGGGDVVAVRIGNVNVEEARGIVGRREVGLDIGVEGVGGIAFEEIVLGEGSIVAGLVEVVVDCSLAGGEEEEGSLEVEREDIQVVEAYALDCIVQLGSGSDSVVVGMEVLAD